MKNMQVRTAKNAKSSKGSGIIIGIVTFIICISIIWFSNSFNKPAEQSSANDTVTKSEDASALVKAEPVEPVLKTDENIQATEKSIVRVEDVPPAPLIFKSPLKGALSVGKIFSVDSLAYSITMEDYRIHTGVDLNCPIGTEVYASAPGRVLSCYEDMQMGYTLVLSHDEGYSTAYSNLSELPPFSPGDEVEVGAKIGTTGQSASCELLDEPHLHFEIIKNNKPLNPMEELEN